MNMATAIQLGVSNRKDFGSGNVSGTTYSSWHQVHKGRLQKDDYVAPNENERVYVIASYGTPIAWYTETGGWFKVQRRFSHSTTIHQNLI